MATFSDITTNVEKLLRMEAGMSVQQYSEDIIGKHLQDSFNRLFNLYWLPDYYNAGEDFTLDGTTGKVTADLTTKIKRWRDVRFIWMKPYIQLLAVKPPQLAPSMLVGLVPMWQPISGDKIFSIFPVTTVGTITVAYRTKPDDFTSNDTVPEDIASIMEAEAAYVYVSDDSANEIAIKRLGQLTESREGDLRVALNQLPRPLAPGRGAPLTVWTSLP